MACFARYIIVDIRVGGVLADTAQHSAPSARVVSSYGGCGTRSSYNIVASKLNKHVTGFGSPEILLLDFVTCFLVPFPLVTITVYCMLACTAAVSCPLSSSHQASALTGILLRNGDYIFVFCHLRGHVGVTSPLAPHLVLGRIVT